MKIATQATVPNVFYVYNDNYEIGDEYYDDLLFKFKCKKFNSFRIGYLNDEEMRDRIERFHIECDDFDAYLKLKSMEEDLVSVLFVVENHQEEMFLSRKDTSTDLNDLFKNSDLYENKKELILNRKYKKLFNEYKELKQRIYEVKQELKNIDRAMPYSSRDVEKYKSI